MSNFDKVSIQPINIGQSISAPTGLTQTYSYTAPSGNTFILGTREWGKVEAFMGSKLAGSFEYVTVGKTLYPNDESEDWDDYGRNYDSYHVAINVGRNFKRQGLATAMVKYAMEINNCTELKRSDNETAEGQNFFGSLVN